ncbi:MAG: type I-C CRISPR-associated protein Cas8c/Csd1, partial [Chloroflexota bacterium]|nr:type I-C CRISPR-associated protein Cas8c/Csd1 [Chloroflexota bacterium]
MLHLLKEYAEKKGLVSEPGFAPDTVRWVIVFSDTGEFLEVVELGNPEEKRNRGQAFTRCPKLSFSDLKSGSIVKCHFLVETVDVVTLISGEKADPKTVKKHKYFLDLLNKAGEVMPNLRTVAEMLESEDGKRQIHARLVELKVKPSEKITLRIGLDFPVENSSLHDWWRDFRADLVPSTKKVKSEKGKSPQSMRSLVTGNLVQPAKTTPKTKHLAGVGGLGTGDVLIGFKQESFCSYGLKQAYNAAVDEEESYVYVDALNDILTNHSTRLAGAKVAHWFKEQIPKDNDPMNLLVEADDLSELNAQRRARQMLESVRSGQVPKLHNNYFYALTLSGASGRVMVRDWMEGQFEELAGNIKNWFDDLEIVHRSGSGTAPSPKFMAVLGATVRDLKNLSAPFVTKMWRVAVRSEPIPQSALAHALDRLRVDIINDKPPNHARMGLMKAYHVRQDKLKGKESNMKSNLNPHHPSPAYHCGRLLAVLAG